MCSKAVFLTPFQYDHSTLNYDFIAITTGRRLVSVSLCADEHVPD